MGAFMFFPKNLHRMKVMTGKSCEVSPHLEYFFESSVKFFIILLMDVDNAMLESKGSYV